MSYWYFAVYNVVDGLIWISSFLYAGYFFGKIPVVKKNFTLVILGIIVVSILPGVIELVRARRARAV